MWHSAEERRRSTRFGVQLNLRYRQSEKGVQHRWSDGITRDMSKDGVAFKTGHPLPVGSHVELRIDWPVSKETHPIDLQATGFVVWSESGEAAVRISSHRFRVHQSDQSFSMPETA